MKRLEGKAALVTGAARGIGAAIAERLAADGAAIIVNYSKSAREAEAVAERIRKANGKAKALKADLGDPTQAQALVEAAFKELGRLDILVNNAAIAAFAPLEKVDQAHVMAHFDLNVSGPIFATQAAIARFPKEGGRVINVSSIVSRSPFPGAGVYAATKAALNALTMVWAAELGPKGITVNAIAPGVVDTDMMRTSIADDEVKGAIGRTPLGRVGTPSDIADVVAFLASSDARWVTGQVIEAAGGLHP